MVSGLRWSTVISARACNSTSSVRRSGSWKGLTAASLSGSRQRHFTIRAAVGSDGAEAVRSAGFGSVQVGVNAFAERAGEVGGGLAALGADAFAVGGFNERIEPEQAAGQGGKDLVGAIAAGDFVQEFFEGDIGRPFDGAGIGLGALGAPAVELALGLAAKIAAIYEKKNSVRFGELDEPVGGCDSDEGLAGAGSPLDERARELAGEGAIQAGAGVNLAGEHALREQRWQRLKAGAEGFALLDPGPERLGPVDAEDEPRAGARIPKVAEARLLTVGFVGEREGIGPALKVGEGGTGVKFRFFGDADERMAGSLGFLDADGLAVQEEHVVGKATFDVGLAEGDARTSVEIEVTFVLNKPPSGRQLTVDFLAGFLFGGFKHRKRACLEGIARQGVPP